MAVDYLKLFRAGRKAQDPPAPAHTRQSDALTPGKPREASDDALHAQELKAEREAIQWEGCSSIFAWLDAIEGVPAEVLAASYDELCDIIDREGEEAGEKFLIRIGRKFRNRA